MKEYGKNIQGLVDHVCGIEDREKRTASAYTIVEIIKQLNPSLKQENDQKLWDDLYIMSDFRLDVDGPFPMPEKELLGKKPLPVGYPRGEVRFKHYGRNIEKLIEKAIEIEDDEEQETAIIYIGQLMRSFHSTWNRDNFDDGIILDDIKTLSKGKLHIDLDKVKENGLFESNTRRDFKVPTHEQSTSNGKNKRGNNNRRRNNGGHKKRRN
ncbi:MAG TPA: DUF4290 domain-containing protein [Algoriphagus sp.]|mgnify:CR=1 FL=1|jgi:hypothetical protein|uniref:DUF4290 domain-containing protein n=1 Tax=Algoriphagus ornithinivorans TaxID=226506 RepID=A0A1I5DSI8_9BACT|nr:MULTISPECIES: DUF4290 domain-containing protein [Algoriphagus]MAL12224.1 DUF4290 domain-containing protein [Algoriphagus sp.]MAN87161.1 DUF4290 domain-containing protein [Algoriphagus sp.]QYH40907.1 DUF4290 domain-containing protein [Algoriphagus sp. NBT04N3]SFO02137.1 protein of unknown function [Algoriphagus ornithinivorans]HAH39018.1 DUF4290 domain-containing protein [Algoriphagus sp.]|tara:strand:- start:186 stop:815 length:630 start_codon:yes stop_codon:yes gene_type:complete